VPQVKLEGMRKHCPRCAKETVVKKIIYGMPSDDFNFEKYEVGGCLIEENAPTHLCTECGKRFIIQKVAKSNPNSKNSP
jgi:predicted RNA-binding Zn-ribbon protein involved in translation (DUF1610 family)